MRKSTIVSLTALLFALSLFPSAVAAANPGTTAARASDAAAEAWLIVERVVASPDPESAIRGLTPRERRAFDAGHRPVRMELAAVSAGPDGGDAEGEVSIMTVGCWRASSRWVARNSFGAALYAYSVTTRTCWFQDTQRVFDGRVVDTNGETFLAGWSFEGDVPGSHQNIFGAVTHKGKIQGHFKFGFGDVAAHRRPCVQHVLQGRPNLAPTFDAYSDCLWR